MNDRLRSGPDPASDPDPASGPAGRRRLLAALPGLLLAPRAGRSASAAQAGAAAAGAVAGPAAGADAGSGNGASPAGAPRPGWPARAVRLVVPAPPGSSLDVIARVLAEPLKAAWGEPVVVDNRAGAGGMIGMQTVARAEPDGTTLGIGFNGPLAFAPSLYRQMAYDPQRDLSPVILTTSQANVLVVPASLPVDGLPAFIEWARAQPRGLTYASVGAGSSSHLTMELLRRAAGFQATHVPFSGAPPAATSVAAGDTQALFAAWPGVRPLVQSGRLRAIATSGERVDPLLPDLPTIAASGHPEVVSLAWNALVAPAGVPQELVARIAADVQQALAQRAVRDVLEREGLTVAGGTPAQAASFIAQERRKWAGVIRDAGITLD